MDLLTQLYALYLAGQQGCSPDIKRVNQKPMSNYTVHFLSRAPHLKTADVVAYRSYVLKHGPFIDETVAADLSKCNKKAAEVRQEGNRLYLDKDYKAALEKYNESLCWAERDSEHLGIGYANR